MPATSWNIRLTGDGTSKVTPTLSHSGTLSGGTSYALPTNEQGVFEALQPALQRGLRRLENAYADGSISFSEVADLNIAISASGYTPTVRKGATLSGSTNKALPTNEVGEARPIIEAFSRARRRLLNAIADGD